MKKDMNRPTGDPDNPLEDVPDDPFKDLLPKLENVIETAVSHLEQVRAEAEAGRIVWTELTTPKPDAMRAFQGQTAGYLLNVAQANIVDVGVTHEGVLIANGCFVIRIPSEDASRLYHQAVAQRN